MQIKSLAIIFHKLIYAQVRLNISKSYSLSIPHYKAD